MSRPSPVLFLLFAVIATACAQQRGSPQSPGQFGAAPAVAPADLIPYRFTGGSGKAAYTAKGKDGTCSGTLTFKDNVVYVDVKGNGDVDPGVLSMSTLTGTATCKGEPSEVPEQFDLKKGSIRSEKINDVTGKPPDPNILGSFKMSGPVCDATIHLTQWVATKDGGRVQIDPVTIKGLKQTLNC